jgi:lipid-binding SYLF domain-containing protein
VGRHAEAGTDIQLKAEIYSYSRSRGLFAGISLEGSALSADDDANSAFYYGKDVNAQDVFSGKVSKAPPVARKLKRTLDKYAK